MLVITRFDKESFMIGDNIVITILGTQSHKVRIGIQAPKDVPVHREEIYRRIQAEKLAKS